MYLIEARNINDAYRNALTTLLDEGVRVETRNGPALRLREPLTTHFAVDVGGSP